MDFIEYIKLLLPVFIPFLTFPIFLRFMRLIISLFDTHLIYDNCDNSEDTLQDSSKSVNLNIIDESSYKYYDEDIPIKYL